MITSCRVVFFLLFSLCFSAAAAADDVDPLALLLHRAALSRGLGSEELQRSSVLVRFYGERQNRLVWSDGRQLFPAADELLSALPAAAEEGLDPRTYHLPGLTERRRRFIAAPTPALAAELDLLLSDAFLTLSSHYLDGRIPPTAVDKEWNIRREEGEGLRMLNQALASGRIRDSLQALLPTDPGYAALRRAWQEYGRLAASGGWPRLNLSSPLRPGSISSAVPVLRQRLTVSGDLPALAGKGEAFDPDLVAAVQRFQSRHGLRADGVVGPATLASLNVPAAQRLRQLALNLERWRWLPRTFGERFLRINLPAFHLEAVEAGRSVLAMRVIIGRQLRQTPAFAGEMTYLVLNPYWEVPHHLAVVDLLPKIQADRSYLEKNNIVVLGAGERRVNPRTIAWSELGAGNFPYRLRQDPGPKNSLGRIKFIFPNNYSIYLHDTPKRELFDREERSFSSGCIRIEKPLELAQLLLGATPLAAPSALEAAMTGSVSVVVPLPAPVPVYLLYFTAAVDGDNTLHFYPDLYRRDSRLDIALHQPQP